MKESVIVSGGTGVGKSELLYWAELFAIVAQRDLTTASYISGGDYSTPLKSLKDVAYSSMNPLHEQRSR